MNDIHIGEIIRGELRRQGKTNRWLAARIYVTPRTVQKIFLKRTIDTGQLLLISQALHTDFFRHYSDILCHTPDLATMTALDVG